MTSALTSPGALASAMADAGASVRDLAIAARTTDATVTAWLRAGVPAQRADEVASALAPGSTLIADALASLTPLSGRGFADALAEAGLSEQDIARKMALSLKTIRGWLSGGVPAARMRRLRIELDRPTSRVVRDHNRNKHVSMTGRRGSQAAGITAEQFIRLARRANVTLRELESSTGVPVRVLRTWRATGVPRPHVAGLHRVLRAGSCHRPAPAPARIDAGMFRAMLHHACVDAYTLSLWARVPHDRVRSWLRTGVPTTSAHIVHAALDEHAPLLDRDEAKRYRNLLTGIALELAMRSLNVSAVVLAGEVGVGTDTVRRWCRAGLPAHQAPVVMDALAALVTRG